MIEKLIRDYLAEKLSVSVYMEYPENPPERFVLVTRTGGGGSHIKTATFAIQSYAKSLYDAAVLNEEVKSTMAWSIEKNEISKSELNSDYEFTDTAKKRYRYQAVFELTYMED